MVEKKESSNFLLLSAAAAAVAKSRLDRKFKRRSVDIVYTIAYYTHTIL